MGMTKTGNTFAPEDKVSKTKDGVKVASRGTGKVIDADPDMATVRVDWGGGDVQIEDAFELEKEE